MTDDEAAEPSAYSSRLRIRFDDGTGAEPPREPVRQAAARRPNDGSPGRTTGVVRVWHADEGWGVVDAEDVPGGCWAHFSAVDAQGYRDLRAGQQVTLEFERGRQDGYDYRAVSVSPLAEGHPGA